MCWAGGSPGPGVGNTEWALSQYSNLHSECYPALVEWGDIRDWSLLCYWGIKKKQVISSWGLLAFFPAPARLQTTPKGNKSGRSPCDDSWTVCALSLAALLPGLAWLGCSLSQLYYAALSWWCDSLLQAGWFITSLIHPFKCQWLYPSKSELRVQLLFQALHYCGSRWLFPAYVHK